MRTPLLGAVATVALALSACGSGAPEVSEPDTTREEATASSEPEEPQETQAAEVQEAALEESAEESSNATAEDVATDDTASEDASAEDNLSEESGDLGLGASASVGDYQVTVTDVQLDATDAVLQTNQFNDAPDGQYVLVSLSVTYTGDGEGNPWLDLSVELAGSDARNYDSSSCSAVHDNAAMDLPTLAAGGKGDFDVCFDVPPEGLDGPKVYVEEWLSWSDTRVVWDTTMAVDPSEDNGDSDSTDGDEPAAARAPDALPLGETTDLGDYSVSVTDVQLDANDVVQQTNSFNDPPDGQYVLVSVEVTYTGDEEGDPWLDLSVELAGSDSRIYSTYTCGAVTPNPDYDLPTLASGGTGSFDACFDVPLDALDNPQIFVEESFTFQENRAVWETGG